jgi:glycosyltransferase involved in cell wall biosynthesis
MLSIIIPTLDEEKHLPLLLESIKKQDFSDYEIIVADAGSKDKTLEIAKSYGCKITGGGLPARGRNRGAKAARGDLLLFLDADVVFPKKIFSKVLKEFSQRKLDIATFCLLPSKNDKMSKFFFTFFYNLPITSLEKVLPHAAMGILIKKALFKKLSGFDEKIKLAEDHDLARRAGKLGKYGILKSTKLFISDRRFKKDGWLKTGSKYLFCEGYTIFIGPVKSDIFKYRFNHYSKNKE